MPSNSSMLYGRRSKSKRRIQALRLLRRLLNRTKRWTKALLNTVLLCFEQMSYGEYMAFDPMREYEETEKKEKYE